MGIGWASRASRCWQWQYHTSEPRLGGGQQQSSSQQTSDNRVCAGRWAEHGASAAAWQTGTRVRPSECAVPCRTGSCDLFPSQPVFAGAVDPGPVHPNFTAGAGSSHDGWCGESLWGDGVARHQPAAPRRGAGVRDRRWDGIFQGMPPRDGWRGGGQQTLTIWGRIAARMDGDVNFVSRCWWAQPVSDVMDDPCLQRQTSAANPRNPGKQRGLLIGGGSFTKSSWSGMNPRHRGGGVTV